MPRLSKQFPPYGQEKIKTGSVFGSVDVSRGGSSTSVNTIDNNAAVVPKKRGRPGRPRLSESNKRAAKLALEKGKESEFATRKSPRTQHVSQTDLQSALRSVRKNKKGSDSDDVCAKCMDDPSVKSCTACGCRKCTKKTNAHNLVVCDGCDGEWHLNCLDPPLTIMPTTELWYCGACTRDGKNKRRTVRTGLDMSEGSLSSSTSASSMAEQVALDPKLKIGPNGVVRRRGRGRPPGSVNKKKNLDTPTSNNTKRSAAMNAKLSSQQATNFREYGYKSGPEPKTVKSETSRNSSSSRTAGLSGASQIINRSIDQGITAGERALLEQLREWGPYSDLVAARKALMSKKEQLYQKIVRSDPLFERDPGLLPGVKISEKYNEITLQAVAATNTDDLLESSVRVDPILKDFKDFDVNSDRIGLVSSHNVDTEGDITPIMSTVGLESMAHHGNNESDIKEENEALLFDSSELNHEKDIFAQKPRVVAVKE